MDDTTVIKLIVDFLDYMEGTGKVLHFYSEEQRCLLPIHYQWEQLAKEYLAEYADKNLAL